MGGAQDLWIESLQLFAQLIRRRQGQIGREGLASHDAVGKHGERTADPLCGAADLSHDVREVFDPGLLGIAVGHEGAGRVADERHVDKDAAGLWVSAACRGLEGLGVKLGKGNIRRTSVYFETLEMMAS